MSAVRGGSARKRSFKYTFLTGHDQVQRLNMMGGTAIGDITCASGAGDPRSNLAGGSIAFESRKETKRKRGGGSPLEERAK